MLEYTHKLIVGTNTPQDEADACWLHQLFPFFRVGGIVDVGKIECPVDSR